LKPSVPALSGGNDQWFHLCSKSGLKSYRYLAQKKGEMGEGQNKGAVFVSHAAEDKNIAEHVINALARGLSLRLDCFFYTSKLSIGVPSGREFFSYIRESICGAKLVISLVSPAFLKSQFCLAESGAAWALGKDWSILMFPGVAPSELGSF
jgi:TIR domain